MSLRLRQLDIRIATDRGPFGVSLLFQNGLNVIRARNSHGKSTCVNSILYALGLEGILGPSHGVPLSAAMIDELITDNETVAKVIQSRVILEIENADNRVVAVERSVTGSSDERQLIRLTHGPLLSQPEKDYRHDVMHVRIAKSATAERGFHRFLADFIGLQLPEVQKGDGIVPLYLECVAPYFIVDQLNGWDAVKSRMPTHYGIIDVAKRAFEFVLAMDILLMGSSRRQKEARRTAIEESWRRLREQVRERMVGTGAIVKDLPSSPDLWKDGTKLQLWATDGNSWKPLNDAVEEAVADLAKITESAIPRVEEITAEVVTQLRVTADKLAKTESRFEHIEQEIRELQAELVDVQKRLDAIDDDLRQYEDEQKIRKRNAVNDFDLSRGLCPSCHQPIKDALVDQCTPLNPMSIPENIAFLRDQRRMFEEMQSESQKQLEAKIHQRTAVRSRLMERSSEMQSLKRTLRQDAEAPAAAVIRQQMLLESRIYTLRSTLEAFSDPTSEFQGLSDEYLSIGNELTNLGKSQLSGEDRAKLKSFDSSFRDQLTMYEFCSYKPQEVSIDQNNYQPIHNEMPLGLISASDMVRMVWAYLIGLLETARSQETNHWGLLLLDEPRQQNVRIESYDLLLKRAAAAKEYGQQVIIASSQLPESVAEEMTSLGVNCRDFASRILSRLDEPSTGEEVGERI